MNADSTPGVRSFAAGPRTELTAEAKGAGVSGHAARVETALLAAFVSSAGLLARRGARRSSRAARAAAGAASAPETSEGRKVTLLAEVDQSIEVDDASVESMDVFMKENATTVCVQAEKVEPAPSPGEFYCWVPRISLGPLSVETRLTVTVDVAESSQVAVRVLDMSSGVVNRKTGEADLGTSMKKFDFQAQNTVTWNEAGGEGLQLSVQARNEITLPIPWWFPLPDVIIQRILTLTINEIVRLTVKKAAGDIKKEYNVWAQAPSKLPPGSVGASGVATAVFTASPAAVSGVKSRSRSIWGGTLQRRGFAGRLSVRAHALREREAAGAKVGIPAEFPSIEAELGEPSVNPGEVPCPRTSPDDDDYDWFGQWYPVHIINNMDPTASHEVQLLGRSLVIRNDGPIVSGQKQVGAWHVYPGTCSTCQGDLLQDGRCNCGAPQHAGEFPSQEMDELLYVWPNNGPGAADDAGKVALPLIEELHNQDMDSWTKIIPAGVRDFPCGWDAMVENTLDPAHFCSAHHNTLGNRYSDPREYHFKTHRKLDRLKGFSVSGDFGLVEFVPPCLVKYVPDYPGMPFKGTLVIATYCVPTAPGFVRPLATVIQNKAAGVEETLATRALSVFMGPVPLWFQHLMAPIVLHQDAGLLYGQFRNLYQAGYRPRQEGNLEFNKLVYCPASNDLGLMTFRRWLRRYGGGGVPWACEDKLLPRYTEDIYDTWHAHTKNCQHCMEAYRNLEALKYACAAICCGAIVFLPVGSDRIWLSVAAAAFGGFLHLFNGLFVRYECSHADNN